MHFSASSQWSEICFGYQGIIFNRKKVLNFSQIESVRGRGDPPPWIGQPDCFITVFFLMTSLSTDIQDFKRWPPCFQDGLEEKIFCAPPGIKKLSLHLIVLLENFFSHIMWSKSPKVKFLPFHTVTIEKSFLGPSIV